MTKRISSAETSEGIPVKVESIELREDGLHITGRLEEALKAPAPFMSIRVTEEEE